MLAALTGQRMLFNYFRIGGVNGDLNHEFMSRLGDWMSRAARADRGQHDAAQRERDLRPADARPGRHRPRDGPADVRDRAEPARDRRPLRRPPGASLQRLPGARVRHPDPRPRATRLARYLLRIDEIKQSLRIIDQCLHQMPDGPIMAKLPRLLRPRPGRAYAAIEGPRGQYATLRDQRRHRPAVPAAHPRPELRPPPGGRPADAGQPDRRHDGDHGLASTRSWAAWTSEPTVVGRTVGAPLARPGAILLPSRLLAGGPDRRLLAARRIAPDLGPLVSSSSATTCRSSGSSSRPRPCC